MLMIPSETSTEPGPLLPVPPPPPRNPYTFWQTAGLFVVVVVLQSTVGGAVAIILALATGRTSPEALLEYMRTIASNGLFIGVSTLVGVPPIVAFIYMLAGLRPGFTAAQYLALKPVRFRTTAFWLATVVVYGVLYSAMSALAGHRDVATSNVDAYRTAGSLPLLALALVVLAPVFEELFFRGLLFRGFTRTGWGQGGAGAAVIVTAALFAILHVQYDGFEVLSILVVGLLFGVARYKTGSTYTTIAMHGFMNLISLIQVAVQA